MKICNNYLVKSLLLALISVVQVFAHEAPSDGFYKREHSLVKPYASAGGQVPFFDLVGDTMVTTSFVRLTPDDKSRAGGLWNKVPVFQRAWEVHVSFKIHGKSRNLAADGITFWYIKERLEQGTVFGGPDKFTGLAVIMDTYKNGVTNSAFPQVSAILNDGSMQFDHDTDGSQQNIGSCYAMLRNRENQDTHLSIRYIDKVLTISVDVDENSSWRLCFKKENVVLPGGYYFGLTAATGDLTDNHDVLAVRTYQLDSKLPHDPEWTKRVPGIEKADGATSLDLGEESDIHRNSATENKSKTSLWITLLLIGVAVCGVVGFVVFQKQQENRRKRFY